VNRIPHPRKAVILAAGFGSRIEPLSYDLPKPLLPLWGETAVTRVVRLLARWGVRDILVNLHHRPGPIVRELAGTSSPRICFSFEPEILGTGGVLKRASWFLDETPFWMVNADIVAELDQRPLLEAFSRGKTSAALWMHPEKGPRTVDVRRGRVTCFRSANPGTPGTFTFCGLQLVSPRILGFVPSSGASSIVRAYEEAMKKGHQVRGVAVPGSRWADLGTPHHYLEAHAGDLCTTHGGQRTLQSATLLRKRGVTVRGFAAVASDASVSAGAEIVNSVVWSGATIGPRARLTDAVVARNTSVDTRVCGVAIACDRFPERHALREALGVLKWSPRKTTALGLPGRGSDRSFTRLVHGARTVMLIRYDSVREENTRYAGHARFLAGKGIPVPRVLADIPDIGTTVVEDVGDESLQKHAREVNMTRLEELYRGVIDAIVTLHGVRSEDLHQAGVQLEPAFTPALYRWEHDVFDEHFLARSTGIGKSTILGVRKELATVAQRLGRAPRVLIHRDLQSSNVLLRKARPVLIDFQGMRMGPAAYNLASLLCDPYMMLPGSLQARLLQDYVSKSGTGAAVSRLFPYAAVQRLAQAIGAFGRFEIQAETAHFGRYIGPAFVMMRRALDELEGFEALRKLADRFGSQQGRGSAPA